VGAACTFTGMAMPELSVAHDAVVTAAAAEGIAGRMVDVAEERRRKSAGFKVYFPIVIVEVASDSFPRYCVIKLDRWRSEIGWVDVLMPCVESGVAGDSDAKNRDRAESSRGTLLEGFRIW